jgi:hypothetical protein
MCIERSFKPSSSGALADLVRRVAHQAANCRTVVADLARVCIAAENCSQPSPATRIEAEELNADRRAVCSTQRRRDRQRRGASKNSRRLAVTRASLPLRRLFRRLAAVRIGCVAEIPARTRPPPPCEYVNV